MEYAHAYFVKTVLKGENMYSKLTNSWLKHWDFILVDLISLELSFLLAYVIRHGFENPFVKPLYQGEAIIFLVSQLLAARAFSGVLRRGYYIEFVYTVKHVLIVMACTLVILFVVKETSTYSRLVLGITGVLYIVFSYITRTILKYFAKNTVGKRRGASLVVVTTEELAQEAIK